MDSAQGAGAELQCTLDDAQAALRSGRYEEALELARWGLERYPGDPFLLDVQARSLAGLRQVSDANGTPPAPLASAAEVEDWRQRQLVQARLLEGRSLRELGRADEAEAVLRELLEEHRQVADAWLLSGWLALDRGAREEARAAFQEFLERCAQQGRTVAPEHEVHRGLRLAGDA